MIHQTKTCVNQGISFKIKIGEGKVKQNPLTSKVHVFSKIGHFALLETVFLHIFLKVSLNLRKKVL